MGIMMITTLLGKQGLLMGVPMERGNRVFVSYALSTLILACLLYVTDCEVG